jgi:hypothetical protein
MFIRYAIWLISVCSIYWNDWFLLLAFLSNSKTTPKIFIIYLGIAILFQPFFKIALDRFFWNIVDLIVGGGFLITLFYKKID